MVRIFILFSIITQFISAGTCGKAEILGVFPKIAGMSCTDYALYIGFVAIISAKLFWDQVTK